MQLSGRQLVHRSARTVTVSKDFRSCIPRRTCRQRSTALVVQNMFTGIVQGLAAVAQVNEADNFKSFKIKFPDGKADGVQIGASVAINGTCLTVTAIEQDVLSFDVMMETLRATSLGALQVCCSSGDQTILKLGEWVQKTSQELLCLKQHRQFHRCSRSKGNFYGYCCSCTMAVRPAQVGQMARYGMPASLLLPALPLSKPSPQQPRASSGLFCVTLS